MSRVCYIERNKCPCDPETCNHFRYILYGEDSDTRFIIGRANGVWWFASKVREFENMGYVFLGEKD